MDPSTPAGSSGRRVALAVLIAAVVGAGISGVTPLRWAPGSELAAASPSYLGIRLTRDDWDRDVYRKNGSWAVTPGAKPFVDVRSEYPQLATYFFALPYLVSDSQPGYRVAFSLLMALLVGATAMLLEALCRRLGWRPARVWLLLLPATLYFSLHRFDLLAALLSLAAFALLLRGSLMPAYAALAAAVLVKVYPVAYLPLFLLWTWQQQGRDAALRGAACFAGFVGLCSLQLALWTSWDAVVRPIIGQASRMDNPESLYHFAYTAIPGLSDTAGRRIFQLLQLSPVLAALWWRPRSPLELLRYAAAVTITMALFSRFQSPQWLVWIAPLAILACATRVELGLLVAADLLTYLYFPVAWDLFGQQSQIFAAVMMLNFAVRGALLVALLRPVSGLRRPRASH